MSVERDASTYYMNKASCYLAAFIAWDSSLHLFIAWDSSLHLLVTTAQMIKYILHHGGLCITSRPAFLGEAVVCCLEQGVWPIVRMCINWLHFIRTWNLIVDLPVYLSKSMCKNSKELCSIFGEWNTYLCVIVELSVSFHSSPLQYHQTHTILFKYRMTFSNMH